jgi:ABC-2 type transport system permease protein
MSYLPDMIWIELRKALRSKVPLFTTLASLFMPMGISFLIFAARNPEISRNLGLVSAKANLTAYYSTNWPSYLGLYAQIIAVGGFLFSCMIMSWVFGREFADGTLKDMLAVPVPRSSILLAKFLVVAVWSAALTTVIFILGLVMGAIFDLPQGSLFVVLQGTVVAAITALLVIAIIMPFALFASIGRGYLLPIGVAILALITANIFVIAGWGEYFPYAVPGLYTQGSSLTPVSYWIVILTGAAGMLGTYFWWKFADQSR